HRAWRRSPLQSFPLYSFTPLLMHPVERHLFATNFKDLAGTRLQGTIALSDELINLGILDFLQGLKANEEAAADADTEGKQQASPHPDPQTLLRLLDIDKLAIKAKEGRIVVGVDVELKE
ncbi:MAG: hypothetical protein AAF840_13405, partial [Bacteroidota bacterium]